MRQRLLISQNPKTQGNLAQQVKRRDLDKKRTVPKLMGYS